MSHDKLRELAQNAIPGPWKHTPCRGHGPVVLDGDGDPVFEAGGGDYTTYLECEDKDAEYIAAANPQTILALLDEIAELRQGRGRYKEDK